MHNLWVTGGIYEVFVIIVMGGIYEVFVIIVTGGIYEVFVIIVKSCKINVKKLRNKCG